MSTKLSRREFLKRSQVAGTALGLAPSTQFQLLLSTLIGSLTPRSATAAIADERHYIHFTIPGAPPKWLFDLPLFAPSVQTTPAALSSETTLAFHLQGNVPVRTPSAAAYHRIVRNQINYFLPPIWKQSVNGKNFASLLDHTLMIRGMDNQINAHAIANGIQVAPLVNGVSLSGLVAELSKKPIPGIGSNFSEAARAFKSARGLGPITVQNEENPLERVLSAYQNTTANIQYRQPQSAQVTQQATQHFEEYAQALGFRESSIRASYENSLEMILSGTYNIKDAFPAIAAKYQALIDAALNPNQIMNVFTTAISPSTQSKWNQYDQGIEFAGGTTADLRSCLTADSNRKPDIRLMADTFATVEILIKNNLSPVFTMAFRSLENLLVPLRDIGTTQVSDRVMNMPLDQHFMGLIPSTFLTTVYYRGFLACLVELVDVLKAEGKFNKTLIHLASEFNRKPKTDGSGSDHAPEGSGVSLISGLFNQFQMTGNTKINSEQSSYAGSWGMADRYFGTPGTTSARPIQVNDVAATIASSFFKIFDAQEKGLVTNFIPIFNDQGLVITPSEVKNNA